MSLRKEGCKVESLHSPRALQLFQGSQTGIGVLAQRVAKLQAAGGEPGLTACRCVKFGAGPADLLAFNEHCSRTHVVDARNFQHEQV